MTSDSFTGRLIQFWAKSDWEGIFAKSSARRHERRRKSMQRQVKAIVPVGIAVASAIWFTTVATNRGSEGQTGIFPSHARR